MRLSVPVNALEVFTLATKPFENPVASAPEAKADISDDVRVKKANMSKKMREEADKGRVDIAVLSKARAVVSEAHTKGLDWLHENTFEEFLRKEDCLTVR